MYEQSTVETVDEGEGEADMEEEDEEEEEEEEESDDASIFAYQDAARI